MSYTGQKAGPLQAKQFFSLLTAYLFLKNWKEPEQDWFNNIMDSTVAEMVERRIAEGPGFESCRL